MTERTVLRTYRQFLEQLTDEMLDIVEAEFGGGLLGSVAKRGAKAATKRIQEEMEEQGRIVVAYATAIARKSEDSSQYERRFLETNPVYRRYDGDDRQALEEHLLSHFRRVGSDLAPLVASERDDFWLALREEYTRAEAEDIVERHFNQAETFKRYDDGVFPSDRLGRRVITVIERGESRLRDDLYTEIDRVYGDSGEDTSTTT